MSDKLLDFFLNHNASLGSTLVHYLIRFYYKHLTLSLSLLDGHDVDGLVEGEHFGDAVLFKTDHTRLQDVLSLQPAGGADEEQLARGRKYVREFMGVTQMLLVQMVSDPAFMKFEQPGAWYGPNSNRHHPNQDEAVPKITCLLSAMILNNIPAAAIRCFIDQVKLRGSRRASLMNGCNSCGAHGKNGKVTWWKDEQSEMQRMNQQWHLDD